MNNHKLILSHRFRLAYPKPNGDPALSVDGKYMSVPDVKAKGILPLVTPFLISFANMPIAAKYLSLLGVPYTPIKPQQETTQHEHRITAAQLEQPKNDYTLQYSDRMEHHLRRR